MDRGAKTLFRTLLIAACAIAICGMSPATADEAEPDTFDPGLKPALHLDDASLPDPVRTPGEMNEDAKTSDFCGEDAKILSREPPAALCETAFKTRGIAEEHRYEYTCAFLVPTSIGGAATRRNVWLQPASETHWKRALDEAMRKRICDGDLSLAQAQRELGADWVSAYRRYLRPGDPPVIIAQPAYDPRNDPSRSRSVRGLESNVAPADVPQAANPNAQGPIDGSITPGLGQSGSLSGSTGGGGPGGPVGGQGGGVGSGQGGGQRGNQGANRGGPRRGPFPGGIAPQRPFGSHARPLTRGARL